jgi:hypothetical protein
VCDARSFTDSLGSKSLNTFLDSCLRRARELQGAGVPVALLDRGGGGGRGGGGEGGNLLGVYAAEEEEKEGKEEEKTEGKEGTEEAVASNPVRKHSQKNSL